MSRLALALAALSLAATACASSGGDAEFPKVVTLGAGEIFASINNQALARGDNRVSIGLTDRNDEKVLDAAMHLKFYDLNGDKPRLRSETDATFVPVELSYIDEQSRDNKETGAGSGGVYIAHATFDEAGDWGVLIAVTRGGKSLKPFPFRFTVLDRTTEPAVGDAAPASRQITLANVRDVSEIDSSYPPRPQMHDLTVADALAAGRPLVVAFATPAFCTSRTCAPVMDSVMDPLYARYHDRASFIHIEPYDLAPLRQSNIQEPVRATREWGLQTEPWVFVVDRSGKIAAKFEGVTSETEVEAALTPLLVTRGAPVPASGGTAAP